MKKKEKIRDPILLETKSKERLDESSMQVQNRIERKKIKDGVQMMTREAPKRIRKLEAELDALREELRQERERRIQAEEVLRKREPLLTERVKEISCLYSLVSLMGDPGYVTEEERVQDMVKMIPTGWYYPEDAYAQIIFGGKEYRTRNFGDTPWKQTSPIFVNGEPQGVLEVGYLREKPLKDEGPFLLEERTLIDVIARLFGEIIGTRLAKKSQ